MPSTILDTGDITVSEKEEKDYLNELIFKR